MILLILLPAWTIVTPRAVAKERLTRVPLKDLALEAQYAEVKEALARYREPDSPTPQEGEVRCRSCGKVSGEDTTHCPCGTFLHHHRVFTCPSCAKVVDREARDCGRCGAAFWSPVNPPASAVTDAMVAEYMVGLEGAGFS
jgi:hypothetical protein